MRMRSIVTLGTFLLAACTVWTPAVPWRPIPLPDARHGHRIEPCAGGLLAFGGSTPGARDSGRDVFWLAPGATSWQAKAPMQRSRNFFASVVVEGDVYAVGGTVERFDPAANAWRTIAADDRLPESHFAAGRDGREILVLGGYPIERSGCFAVSVDTGAVRAVAPPPGFEPGDHFHFAANVGGELHVVGGIDVAVFETQPVHHVRRQGEWVALTPPPPGLWAKFGDDVVHGGQWWLFGEFGGWCYTPESGWQERAAGEDLVAMPVLAAVGGELWRIGGMPVEGPRRPLLRRYEIGADRWRAPVLP